MEKDKRILVEVSNKPIIFISNRMKFTNAISNLNPKNHIIYLNYFILTQTYCDVNNNNVFQSPTNIPHFFVLYKVPKQDTYNHNI